MKMVRCEFVNPNENMDIKKKNGFSLDSDAIINNDGLKMYCTRRDIVQLIIKSYSEHELVYGKKKVVDNNLRYSFYITIENSVKGCIVIDIPTTMLMMDNNAKTMKKILDGYQGRAVDRRKKEFIKTAFIAAGGLALLLGSGKLIVDGVIREFEANYERNRKWYEDYERHNSNFEGSLVNGEVEYVDSATTCISNEVYPLPQDYLEYEDTSKVLKKTR